MQRREHHSTLRPQSEIYGPRVTQPILHWGFGLSCAKEALSVWGAKEEGVCVLIIFFLKLEDLGGGRSVLT